MEATARKFLTLVVTELRVKRGGDTIIVKQHKLRRYQTIRYGLDDYARMTIKNSKETKEIRLPLKVDLHITTGELHKPLY